MNNMDWSLVIEIVVIIGSVIGSFYVLKNKTNINTIKLEDMEKKLEEHCKETPAFKKKFADLGIELINLKNEQINKSNTLQTIVNQIVNPSFEKFSIDLKSYIDTKIQFVDKEIELMKVENNRRILELQKSQNSFEKMAFELIEVSNKNVENQIDRLVDLLKNKI